MCRRHDRRTGRARRRDHRARPRPRRQRMRWNCCCFFIILLLLGLMATAGLAFAHRHGAGAGAPAGPGLRRRLAAVRRHYRRDLRPRARGRREPAVVGRGRDRRRSLQLAPARLSPARRSSPPRSRTSRAACGRNGTSGRPARLALALQLLYTLLEIRRIFQGPSIDVSLETSQGELWTYSIALLVIGVAILAVGFLRDSRPLRLLSAGYIIAAVAQGVPDRSRRTCRASPGRCPSSASASPSSASASPIRSSSPAAPGRSRTPPAR